jgi:hypothetical protein
MKRPGVRQRGGFIFCGPGPAERVALPLQQKSGGPN